MSGAIATASGLLPQDTGLLLPTQRLRNTALWGHPHSPQYASMPSQAPKLRPALPQVSKKAAVVHTPPTQPSQSPRPTPQLPTLHPPLSFCSAFPSSQHALPPSQLVKLLGILEGLIQTSSPQGDLPRYPPPTSFKINLPTPSSFFTMKILKAPEKMNMPMPLAPIHRFHALSLSPTSAQYNHRPREI